MMAAYWFRIAGLIGLLGAGLRGQAQDTTPLHTFFQRNYDSTIIYQSGLSKPNGAFYLILAKQKDQVYFFLYQNPYSMTQGRYLPGMQQFAKLEAAFRAAVPDTNRYLLPGTVRADTLRRSWQRLRPRRLWAIRGDGPDHFAAKNCAIDHGDTNIFFLIDRQSIRAARFYAPAYWEECAGPDRSRQQAIAARALFFALRRTSQQNGW